MRLIDLVVRQVSRVSWIASRTMSVSFNPWLNCLNASFIRSRQRKRVKQNMLGFLEGYAIVVLRIYGCFFGIPSDFHGFVVCTGVCTVKSIGVQ